MNNADAWASVPEVLARQASYETQDSAFHISILSHSVPMVQLSHFENLYPRVPALN